MAHEGTYLPVPEIPLDPRREYSSPEVARLKEIAVEHLGTAASGTVLNDGRYVETVRSGDWEARNGILREQGRNQKLPITIAHLLDIVEPDGAPHLRRFQEEVYGTSLG